MTYEKLLFRSLLLSNLIQIAENYGIPFPIVLEAAKHIGRVITGTALSEMPSSGISRNIFLQALSDTRSLHLWVISGNDTQDILSRLCWYGMLEGVGVKFGHLHRGSVAIGTGGVRHMIATGLEPEILYNSTQVKKVLQVEQNAIKIAGLIGTKGKKILPVILKLIGGHQEELISKPIIVEPLVDPKTIKFQQNCEIIIKNMMEEHTMRRAFNASSQNNKILVSTFVATSTTSANLTPFIFWTSFGLGLSVSFIVLSLSLFQHAERKRLKNRNDEVTIDVDSSY